jgi:cytochrome c5
LPYVHPTAARTEYVPEFGRSVHIAEYDRPMSSDDIETAQTIGIMDELAAADTPDPAVYGALCEACSEAGLSAGASPEAITKAVWYWLKRTVQYVPTPGTSALVDQTLISPCAVLAMPQPIGDCAQFSMLARAMLAAAGINSLFVTIKAEPLFPDQWSHVYNTVEVKRGRWMPFDASNGPEPGAEYMKPFGRRIWPRLTPLQPRKETAADMVRNAKAKFSGGMKHRSLHGAMGVLHCDDADNCWDDATPDAPAVYVPPDTTPAPIFTTTAAGTPWYQTLLTDATQLAAPLIRSTTQKAPYYIASPSGQSVLYNPNTGAVMNASSIGSAINPTYMLLGVGLLAVVLVAGKK